jgi:hypothetical protein
MYRPAIQEGTVERQGCRNPYRRIEERERHDVLKRFKGASLYKRERDTLIKNIKMVMPCTVPSPSFLINNIKAVTPSALIKNIKVVIPFSGDAL